MKKLLAIFCLLAICLPLISCSSGLTAQQTATANTAETVTKGEKEEKGEIVYPDGFSVGFGRVDISGPLPVDVWESQATVVGDPLMLTVVAVCDGENVALLYGFDWKFIDESFEKQGKKLLQEKFGIPASAIVDYLAMIGDNADNIPGIAGVGPKTAAQLLNKFGSIENMLAKVHEIERETLRNKIEQGAELLKKNRCLP